MTFAIDTRRGVTRQTFTQTAVIDLPGAQALRICQLNGVLVLLTLSFLVVAATPRFALAPCAYPLSKTPKATLADMRETMSTASRRKLLLHGLNPLQ